MHSTYHSIRREAEVIRQVKVESLPLDGDLRYYYCCSSTLLNSSSYNGLLIND